MTSQPIVVGYDGSPSAQQAVKWAAAEGLRTGRPLLLAHAFVWPAVPMALAGPGIYPQGMARRDAERMVQEAAAEAAKAHPKVTITGTLLDGPPAVVLVERSREASLVVLGNRGHGGFAQLLLGSTGVAVSAHAHCPVVIVRGDERPAPAHVLVGVDGSPSSLLALRYAFAQAADRAVPLRVVRVWNMSEPMWSVSENVPRDLVAAEQKALDELLANWRAEYPDVEVVAEVVVDAPGRALVRASREAELAVVGSRGRGGFTGLLLGSVSQQLLHHSHCPVAVIRELPDDSDAEEPVA